MPKPYFDDGGGRLIYLGDAAEIVPALDRKFDLLLCDPPYGIGAGRRSGFGNGVTGVYKTGFLKGKTRIGTKNYVEGDWDDKPVDSALLALVGQACTPQIIFGGNYFPLSPARCWLLWDKLNGDTDFADGEMAWTNMDKAVRIFRYLWNGMMKEKPEFRDHPTQNPLALMKWCIKQAPETVKSVLDPFLGSGTTLVAAKAFGLEAVGIEKIEAYAEVAAKRLQQGVLFG